MLRYLILVLPLTLSTLAIRVPVEGKNENTTEITSVNANKKQDTFYVSDDTNVDSYLIPPDPHRPEEVLPDVATLATYLLPPSAEKQMDYYAPTEAGEQTDWYPIAHDPIQSTPINLLPPRQPDVIPILVADNDTFQIIENPRGGKAYHRNQISILLPSRQLEPPFENSGNNYPITIPSEELELPSKEVNQSFRIASPPPRTRNAYHKNPNQYFTGIKPAEPTLALHLTPPKLQLAKYKNPTKLYPKKVSKGFQPIPIPIAQFAEDSSTDVPRAKPVKPFKPDSNDESEYFKPSDEKKIYLYEQAEQKRKLKGENEPQQPAAAVQDTYGVNAPAEQETSETNYRHTPHTGRNVYPAPIRQASPPPVPVPQRQGPTPSPTGERTEFRMHGMKGPHSYQFGFDTGKGKNRQFRYEERDNDGRVKGHYGYMDKQGKIRVVNYDADPEHGFHAEAPVETE